MGETTIEAPPPPAPPPSPGQTAKEAIQAQIDALPGILQAQQEFGPQFSQLSLEQLQQFGPQFAQTALDLQREFAPQFVEIERQLNPELAEAQRTLTDFLRNTDEEEFQNLLPGLIEQTRSAQSIRGIGDISPLGAIDESIQVQQLKESLKNRRLNIALSTAGRIPITGTPTVIGQTGGPGQLVQNIDPSSIFGAQSSINAFNQGIFGTQANIFGTQQTAATAARQQNFELLGPAIGAGGAIGAALICWVAAELFGGWNHPKTNSARFFVLNHAPKWFREFYIKHGEKFAEYIKDKPMIKALIRPLFEVFAYLGATSNKEVIWQ